jgi:hypothetical protein
MWLWAHLGECHLVGWLQQLSCCEASLLPDVIVVEGLIGGGEYCPSSIIRDGETSSLQRIAANSSSNDADAR